MADSSRWVEVPPDVAKKHPLYGIGGWLILVAISCVVAPIRTVIQLTPVYSGIDYSTLPPMLTNFIVIEIGLNGLIVLWSIVNAFLLFRRHRAFPRSFAAMMAFSAIFVVGDVFATKAMMEAIGQPMEMSELFDAETSREVGRTIVAALIWIPYTFVSKRVHVTFLSRVRSDDPILVAPATQPA